MTRQRAITTALILLFAAVLSLGGASAVHLLGDHYFSTPEARCCESQQEAPVLPAEHDSQEEECPECDLLTTLTLADTSAGADLIVASAPQQPILTIEVAPAVAQTRAPRTTRGPPAA